MLKINHLEIITYFTTLFQEKYLGVIASLSLLFMIYGGETPLFTRINNTWNYIKVLTSSRSSLERDMIRFTNTSFQRELAPLLIDKPICIIDNNALVWSDSS